MSIMIQTRGQLLLPLPRPKVSPDILSYTYVESRPRPALLKQDELDEIGATFTYKLTDFFIIRRWECRHLLERMKKKLKFSS